MDGKRPARTMVGAEALQGGHQIVRLPRRRTLALLYARAGRFQNVRVLQFPHDPAATWIHRRRFFCDEKGVRTDAFPGMAWKNEFRPVPEGTEVTVDVTFNPEEDLQRIIELGFEEGFTMAHGNLDELLAQHR